MDIRLQTCRLCGDSNFEQHRHKYPLIRYSTRASAHADCALARWGVNFFERLDKCDLEQFPALAAHEVGLLDALRDAIKRKEQA